MGIDHIVVMRKRIYHTLAIAVLLVVSIVYTTAQMKEPGDIKHPLKNRNNQLVNSFINNSSAAIAQWSTSIHSLQTEYNKHYTKYQNNPTAYLKIKLMTLQNQIKANQAMFEFKCQEINNHYNCILEQINENDEGIVKEYYVKLNTQISQIKNTQ